MSIGSNINRIQLAKESIQKTLLKSGANVQGIIDNYEQPILDTPKRVLDLICKTVNNSNATPMKAKIRAATVKVPPSLINRLLL